MHCENLHTVVNLQFIDTNKNWEFTEPCRNTTSQGVKCFLINFDP